MIGDFGPYADRWASFDAERKTRVAGVHADAVDLFVDEWRRADPDTRDRIRAAEYEQAHATQARIRAAVEHRTQLVRERNAHLARLAIAGEMKKSLREKMGVSSMAITLALEDLDTPPKKTAAADG